MWKQENKGKNASHFLKKSVSRLNPQQFIYSLLIYRF
jgi:hypothetical protein